MSSGVVLCRGEVGIWYSKVFSPSPAFGSMSDCLYGTISIPPPLSLTDTHTHTHSMQYSAQKASQD